MSMVPQVFGSPAGMQHQLPPAQNYMQQQQQQQSPGQNVYSSPGTYGSNMVRFTALTILWLFH